MNKKGEHIDMLGESHLPSDLFTDTDALNGLLDTFPDLGKGMGVLESEVLGEPKSPPSLPDGVVTGCFGDEDDPDAVTFGGLGDISETTRTAGLADLSWLDLAEQDPDRLPKNPVDRGIPELEEAWGVDRRTDGVHLVPTVDAERARYEDSLLRTADQKRSAKAVSEVVRSAWRKVTAGASFASVAREAAERLGPDAPEARDAMTRIRDDAGLIGRVFIRAANYPDCATSKWASSVRKQAEGAAYVVTKKACGGCVHAQDGSCAVFKKRLVSAVPWDAALRRYEPTLTAAGKVIPEGLPAKEALRKAFAQESSGVRPAGDVRPTHLVAADQVSSEEARRAFARAAPVKVASLSAATLPEALGHMARWVKAGVLRQADAKRIAASKVTPDAMLRASASMIGASRHAAFSGNANEAAVASDVAREAAWSALSEEEARQRGLQAQVLAEADRREVGASRAGRRTAAIQAKVAKVTTAVQRGLRGEVLANLIRSTFASDEAAEAGALLDPLLRRTGALREVQSSAREFGGPRYERAPAVAREAHGPAHGEVQRLARWVRQKMSEGAAGSELDQLLTHRFAGTVRTAAADVLGALRQAHEGLSGHVYVDAEAYASGTGAEGCENGALKHRANAVPTVLQMARCASCTNRALLADGTASCRVYNKPLVASAPVEDPEAYRLEAIRLADAPDEERTAALFSNTYDASEFQLGGESELDRIVLADAPENEKVAEVFSFGGMDLE